MKAYLQCGDTLPTEIGGILKNVADDLLIRKWHFEKYSSTNNPADVLTLKNSGIVELTAENKADLDLLKGQSSTDDDPPAFNFDTWRTEGGFED